MRIPANVADVIITAAEIGRLLELIAGRAASFPDAYYAIARVRQALIDGVYEERALAIAAELPA